jgi:glucosamine--fructose-6-phosphate aminotransferase (isomerizing)
MKSLGNFPDPFIREIHGQPGALRRAATGLDDQAVGLAFAGERRGGSIVLCGMGSSYDACYPAATILAAHGVACVMVDAAELLHFRLAMLDTADTLILVSQSGESAETVGVAEALRARGDAPRIVSVTNGRSNALVSGADVALDTRAGEEAGPSTMTFAASLVVVGALARTLAGEPAASAAARVARDAREAAASIERLLDDEALAEALARWHDGRSATVILGRGGARAAAEMGALTIKEAAGIPVESLEAGQFRHGPLELAGPGLAAIVIATEPETRELDLALATRLRELGSAVWTVVADGDTSDAPSTSVGRLDRVVAPAAAIVPIQLLAWRLAARAGREPGAYVHATKVTTRE